MVPPRIVITSEGRVAVPEGMFSARASHPVTRTGSPSRATATTVPSTAAAPDMSLFMSSMPAGGLSEMPPVSNVIPLPTRATWALAPAGE